MTFLSKFCKTLIFGTGTLAISSFFYYNLENIIPIIHLGDSKNIKLESSKWDHNWDRLDFF
jgi:hypothetical protein